MFFLKQHQPAISLTQNLSPENYNNEEFLINDYCVYLNCKLGYGQAKCNNNFFENKLKITATTRNYCKWLINFYTKKLIQLPYFIV